MFWIWLAVILNLLLLSYFYGELDTKRRHDGAKLADALSALTGSLQQMQRHFEEQGSEIITIRERMGYEAAQVRHTGKLPPLYPALYDENGLVPRVFDVRTGLARSVRDIESQLKALKSELAGHLTETSQPVAQI